MNKKTRYIIFFLLIFFLQPREVLGEKIDKIILVIVDELSFSQIEDLGLDYGQLGLMNLKTRKPYSREAFYLSLNLGRKVNREELETNSLGLDYLGDLLRDENPSYLGSQEDRESLVLRGRENKINFIDSPEGQLKESLAKGLEESNLLALKLNISRQEDLLDLKNIIEENKDHRIYVVPEAMSQDQASIFNSYLSPVLIVEGDRQGLLTSQSTRREGFIVLEDISVDIKNNFLKEDSLNIGKDIDYMENSEGLARLEAIYQKTINLLLISWVLHGVFYLAQVYLFYSLYRKKDRAGALGLGLFSLNNIGLSLLLAGLNLHRNLLAYLLIILVLNIFITRLAIKDYKYVKPVIVLTYLMLSLFILVRPELIYNSYIGYNSLIYGARFYGFNNGAAGVLLASSILLIDMVEEARMRKVLRKGIILAIGLLNIIILSSSIGANTGSFISSILLLGLISYYYILPRDWDLRVVFMGLGLLGILGGLILYLDNIRDGSSHAILFINRIRNNGFRELYYMASHKAGELIKYTILPPFSLVILAQVIVISRFIRTYDREFRLVLTTAILGFLINDTGNVLLIYMLGYGILNHYFKEDWKELDRRMEC